MKKIRIHIVVLLMGLFGNGAMAQSLDTLKIDVLQQFRETGNAEQQLKMFFNIPNRYIEDSAYEWLEVVNTHLGAAEKEKDSMAVYAYKLMQAELNHDIGDYNKSIAIARDVYTKKDSLDNGTIVLVLDLLDKSYGRLQMFDKQIAIREDKKKLGLTERVAFYDIYANMGLYHQAMEQYILAVKPTIPDNDHLALAQHHNIVGNYLRLDKSAATAITEYNKANGYLEVFINDITKQKTENEVFESESLKAEIEGNIGKCHVLLREYIKSIPYLKQSIEVLSEYNNRKYQDQIIDNKLNLAEAHLQLDNNVTAKRLLEGPYYGMYVTQRLKRNRLLAYYYDKIENFKSAAIFYKRNERLLDSLKTNEVSLLKQQLVAIVGTSDLKNSRKLFNEQKLANEKIRSEIQAKNEQISFVFISLVFTLLGFAGLIYAYLKSIKNQRLIAEQKHFIESSLKEKESLLKEIHHRVKNNLQMVSSLLSLQTRNTKSKAAIVALEEGKSRVKAMALIHQKLYQNDDLSVIEMQGYIESLINSVQSVYKKGGHNISITVDAEGTELDIDRAIPFGLILNELVSNTFKYAFPESDENGKIYIHLRKNKEEGYFEYADNGVGLPEDTDERTSGSMGLRLINRLVNQLQSKLNVEHASEGVRFWFSFK